MDVDGGYELGKGTLYFSDWDFIKINRFDPFTNVLSPVTCYPVEALKDLCKVDFSSSTIFLAGFGAQIGYWMEWNIVRPKMHAEFEDSVIL